jgi:ATP-dependent RNA helicase SUPV3L1/SUV3
MMSIMGCSGEELALILESLGFRREKRPLKKAVTAPAPTESASSATAANDNVAPSDNPVSGDTQEAEAEAAAQLPGSGERLEEQDAIAASVSSEASAAEEAPATDATSTEAQADQGTPAEMAGASAPAEQAAPGEEAASGAEVEFEEIWRFRRPKPKFERPEGKAGGRPQRHGSGDRNRERANRPQHDRQRNQTQAAGDAQRQPDERKRDGANSQKRDGQQRGQQHDRHDRQRSGKPHFERNRDRQAATGATPQAGQQLEKGEAQSNRPAAQPQQQQHHQQRGPRRQDRGNERGRDGKSQRPHGKQPFTASASPRKSSGTIDPDSPFAALSQLKERMEKQVQTQDETV